MADLTKQEAFDRMVAHLREQKAFSIRKLDLADGETIPGCAYRGEGGVKCAVGCLIPDELYSFEMENSTPATYTLQERMGWSEDFADFLSHAQHSLHDTLWCEEDPTFHSDIFENAARNFAECYELVYTLPAKSDA